MTQASGADLHCPQCGAPVPVRSAAMPYAVCAYCNSVIRREAEGLERIGEAASLPFDVSPLQLGVRGVASDGTGFVIVGRVRWGWDDGAWNEWLLALAHGGHAWLGEAMGQFQFLTERADLAGHPALASWPLPQGLALDLDGHRFTASDVKRAQCLGGEGDLPYPVPAGLVIDSVDFREESGLALSVQRDEAGVSAYLGAYVELAALQPRGLRVVDGWAIPAYLREGGR